MLTESTVLYQMVIPWYKMMTIFMWHVISASMLNAKYRFLYHLNNKSESDAKVTWLCDWLYLVIASKKKSL